MQLSPQQIAALTRRYFDDQGPQRVAELTATFLGESGGRVDAYNAANENGTTDAGLPQINSAWGFDEERLRSDPEYAMAAARYVYDQQGIEAWSAWNAGTALEHWDDAAQATDLVYRGGARIDRDLTYRGEPLTRENMAGKARSWAELSPAQQQEIRATLGATGQGSTTVAQPQPAGAPVSTLTGVELTKLAAYLADLLAGRQQAQAGITGYTQTGAPTLARDMFAAARSDADRQYGLDLQRYGLAYADTAFRQRLDSASQQIQLLDLQTRRSGPEDWLRYNHIINNKPAPASPTVDPMAGPGAVPPTLAIGGGGGGAAPGGGAPGGADPGALARAQAMSAAWNAGDFAKYQGLGGTAAIPTFTPPQGAAPSADTRPDVGGVQGAGWTPQQYGDSPLTPGQDAPGSASATQTVDLPGGQQITWDPNAPGNGLPGYAHGGMTQPQLQFGGMHAGVVGDPQRPREPNPEIVMSAAPIFVKPIAGDPGAKRAAKGLPKRATGGVIGEAPFVEKLNAGGPAFGARGEALGPYGTQPFNYARFLQLLPSEQAMTKGYIETPKDQGGLGSYFPDELARAQRSSFQGLSFGPSTFAA